MPVRRVRRVLLRISRDDGGAGGEPAFAPVEIVDRALGPGPGAGAGAGAGPDGGGAVLAFVPASAHDSATPEGREIVSCVASAAGSVSTSAPCWWCRHPFTSIPVSLPLRYEEDSAEYRAKMVELNTRVPAGQRADFFETEGVFCSFECAKAYALEQHVLVPDGTYLASLGLLDMLRRKAAGGGVFATHTSAPIRSAPSWRLLAAYGGPLSIEQFRTGSTEYVPTSNVRRTLMFPLGRLFEAVRDAGESAKVK
jgi:hypothetical protein